MYLLFEKGMKCGVYYIFKGYRKANNKYLKSFDPKQKLKHTVYLDAVNLYCYAMSEFLRTSGFKVIDPKNFHSKKYSSNNSEGCGLDPVKLILNVPKNYMNYVIIIL